ncbi:hypothetical protein P8C59_009134 [Phyllachora maydis]|uniref:Uncharacterized protein n=1 Tax=Phyllachora maydis TaxID=1825666 RepID=A0AAD9ICH4_9PEZI|nr:hypothetical protein P8C59_009134 [Phyllachora maydis]
MKRATGGQEEVVNATQQKSKDRTVIMQDRCRNRSIDNGANSGTPDNARATRLLSIRIAHLEPRLLHDGDEIILLAPRWPQTRPG